MQLYCLVQGLRQVFFVLGQSLTEFTQPLKSFGVKKGSKIMLIGKKVRLPCIYLHLRILMNLHFIYYTCLFSSSHFVPQEPG